MRPDGLGMAVLVSVALTLVALAAVVAALTLTPAALDLLGTPKGLFRDLAYGVGVIGLTIGIYAGIGRYADHWSRRLRDRR